MNIGIDSQFFKYIQDDFETLIDHFVAAESNQCHTYVKICFVEISNAC